MLTRDFLCHSKKEFFFVSWGGKSIPVTAEAIFFLAGDVLFPYRFDPGILPEDFWLATGALVTGVRLALKFGRWEKIWAYFCNFAFFTKALVRIQGWEREYPGKLLAQKRNILPGRKSLDSYIPAGRMERDWDFFTVYIQA
jgi:hypothetical protein